MDNQYPKKRKFHIPLESEPNSHPFCTGSHSPLTKMRGRTQCSKSSECPKKESMPKNVPYFRAISNL